MERRLATGYARDSQLHTQHPRGARLTPVDRKPDSSAPADRPDRQRPARNSCKAHESVARDRPVQEGTPYARSAGQPLQRHNPHPRDARTGDGYGRNFHAHHTARHPRRIGAPADRGVERSCPLTTALCVYL